MVKFPSSFTGRVALQPGLLAKNELLSAFNGLLKIVGRKKQVGMVVLSIRHQAIALPPVNGPDRREPEPQILGMVDKGMTCRA
jgi:hypothetical protein